VFKSQYKIAVTGILILFAFVISCTKIDSTKLGQDLIPTVDNIHTFDTVLNVIATNFDDQNTCDSIVGADLHALGIISNDPLFGKTTANIYLELKPTAYPFTFPAHDKDSLLIDSAVIVLQYSHSFGDTNTLQKAQVFPLTENFIYDTVYTTCHVFDYGTDVLGEKLFVPKSLKDSLHAFKENASNQLRIPISNSLIQNFVANQDKLANDSLFTNFFKGFAIVADQLTGGQALNYFDLTSPGTRLSIYTRSSKENVKDSTVINFPLTAASGQANSIIRERGNSEITNHLTHPAEGDSLIYIQTSPGSYAQLTIPGLAGLSNRVINRAELIVQQEYSPLSSDNIFQAPSYLYLDVKDTSAAKYLPVPCDFSQQELSNNFGHLGGTSKKVMDASGNQVSQYSFNISRYVQSIVTKGKGNPTFRLSAPYYVTVPKAYADACNQLIPAVRFPRNNIAEGRVRLNGTNNTATSIKLRVVYSVL
jgi:hypothetical protein